MYTLEVKLEKFKYKISLYTEGIGFINAFDSMDLFSNIIPQIYWYYNVSLGTSRRRFLIYSSYSVITNKG